MNAWTTRVWSASVRACIAQNGVPSSREGRTHVFRNLPTLWASIPLANRRHLAVEPSNALDDVRTEERPQPATFCLHGPAVEGLGLDEEELLVTRGPKSRGDMYALREELFHSYF
mmetsp:Transcript_26685/g.70045  ORF Transcript_26685/g.70045 Transcript_26685/m.70045 type:complete len:115 (-) Transcript_26685:492-836(-)